MKSKHVLLVAVLALMAAVIVACTPTGGEPESTGMEGETKTLFVGPEEVDCTGAAPQKCLQVREDADGDYEFFFSTIEGFTFEPGFEYELLVRVDPVENPPADGSSLSYTLVEVVSKTPVAVETSSDRTEVTELVGVRWLLISYLNAAGETVDALADVEVTAEFDADGRVSGQGGCNSYFAGYTRDGDALTITEAGSTLMACLPDEVMAQETAFLAALQSAATFSIDGGMLHIANADGATALMFRATEPATLTGTTWTAAMVNNGLEAVTNLVVDTTITANFTEDGKLNGLAGCNNYMTSYTLDGQSITIQPAASTRKLCPEPEGVMEQEAAFLELLPQTATYSISGNTLELRTADGALIVSFSAAQ